MKVAVTGATGFVGSSLARALVAEGAAVRALARAGSDRARLDGLPVEWRTGDVLDPASLRDVFADVDCVVHAAGRLGEAGVSERAYFQLHVDGTSQVLRAIAARPAPPRLLYVSSPGVLGPIDGPPAVETAPRAPSNRYERSKAAAEEVALRFAREGLPIIIARPEFIYGPGDRHVLGLFQAIQRRRFFYVGDGRALCHPTYIDDAVAGMLRALKRGAPGAIYHLAGPRPVTFRDLAETIAAAVGVRPPRFSLPRPIAWLAAATLEAVAQVGGPDPPLSRDGVAFFGDSRAFDWSKAHRELGYRPAVSLADGVARTVAAYRAAGWLAR